MTLANEAPLIFSVSSTITPIIDPTAMTKSNIFYRSMKYLEPRPIIFIIASTPKMAVNAKFTYSRACVNFSS